jgi:hypothetical protein
MATLVKNAFHSGPGSHCNLWLDSVSGLSLGSVITVGNKYTAIIEALLPFNTVKVRMTYMAAPGTVGTILRTGASVGLITISSLAPSTAVHGTSAFTLTVNGGGFQNGCVVLWGGSARPTTFVSATQVTAQISATDILNAGTVSVTVQTGGNSSPGSNFTIT